VESGLPGGPSYHQDLLRGMALPLAVVRPAVLNPARLGDLAELLAFRHFFRHAYAVALDEAELRSHAARLERTHRAYVRICAASSRSCWAGSRS